MLPSGPLNVPLAFDQAGNLHGTTNHGGTFDACVVFVLAPATVGFWSETVLHSFAGDPADGARPECRLIFDVAGNIHGATPAGGPQNVGAVFRVSPTEEGWTETILYNFPGGVDGPDGRFPEGWSRDGRPRSSLRVTEAGGAHGAGAVFELVPGENGYGERIILSLDGYDGAQPTSGLAKDKSGNLYGATAFFGGEYGDGAGTIFQLSKNSTGGWTERTLRVLHGPDGYMAQGPPAFDDAGNLYATAESGGLNGMETVLTLIPTETGEWTGNVLHRLDFKYPDGIDGETPYSGVIFDRGKLFGTTPSGAPQRCRGCVRDHAAHERPRRRTLEQIVTTHSRESWSLKTRTGSQVPLRGVEAPQKNRAAGAPVSRTTAAEQPHEFNRGSLHDCLVVGQV